jgi:plastocyanin
VKKTLAPIWLTVAALLFVAACSNSTKVGNSNLLNIKNKVGGGFDVTTTTAEASGTLPLPSTTTPRTTVVAVTTPHRTTTTISAAQKKAITAVIQIEGASTSAFNPSLQTVYPGTPVQWVNHDSQTRSVVSDDGSSFSSGPIPPGGSYTWTTTGSPRRINYHDGTRPYAVADLDVVPSP